MKIKGLQFFLLLFQMIFLSNICVAQNIASIEWSDILAKTRIQQNLGIIDRDEEGFTSIRRTGGAYVIGKEVSQSTLFMERYTNDMELVVSKELNFDEYEGIRRISEVVFLKNNAYLIIGELIKSGSDMGVSYSYKKIDAKNLRLSEETKVLRTIEVSRSGSGLFTTQSSDSTKLLVFNSNVSSTNDSSLGDFEIFDEEFNLLWKRKISKSNGGKQYVSKGLKLGNDGNVYTLCNVNANPNDKRKEAFLSQQYSILVHKKEKKEAAEYNINLENKLITNLTYDVENKDYFICAGFYTDLKIEGARGAFSLKINKESKEIFDISYKKFDLDFLTYRMGKKKRAKTLEAEKLGDEKKQAKLFNYVINDLVFRKDGGMVLIAERQSISIGSESTIFRYGDIIAVNINKESKIDWYNRIRKNQASTISTYCSFITIERTDGLYFLYNDNRLNINDKDKFTGAQSAFTRDGVITIAKLGNDGGLTRSIANGNESEELSLTPNVHHRTGEDTMIIHVEGPEEFKFGKLKIK